MKKNIPLIIFIISILFSITSCSSKFKKDKTGLEYILFPAEQQENNRKLKLGDLLEMSLSYSNEENGVELFNSKNNDRKYLRKLGEASHTGGCFEDGLLLMSIGDSAVFRIIADDFLLKTEHFNAFPNNVKSGDMIIVKLKIINVLDNDDTKKIITNKYHESESVELELLYKYLKNSNIDTVPNSAGVFIKKIEAGEGKIIESGSIVTINFMLSLIDGNIIETSFGKEAFVFKIDNEEVIKGLNDGLKTMREGDNLIMVIPSKLAYGKEGKGNIQAFSTLVFNIEILNVK